jgi:hypothetical protein
MYEMAVHKATEAYIVKLHKDHCQTTSTRLHDIDSLEFIATHVIMSSAATKKRAWRLLWQRLMLTCSWP